MKLSDLPLVDLFIGPDWSDYTEHSGVNASRVSVPQECVDAVEQIRAQCKKMRAERNEDRFSISHGGEIYRVTAFDTVNGEEVNDIDTTFFLARGKANILPLAKLGLPPHIREKLLGAEMTGLVLWCGPRGAGKSTSCNSILIERLRRHGSTALALQDPVEHILSGLHGKGRCIQSPISRIEGGYSEIITQAARTRVSMLLLGEICDPSTAWLALEMGASGVLTLSSLHGDASQDRNMRSSLNRLLTNAARDLNGDTDAAAELISQSLSMLIQQRLEPIEPGSKTMRAVLTCLDLNDTQDGTKLRTMIRNKDFERIQQVADEQVRRFVHRPREQREN